MAAPAAYTFATSLELTLVLQDLIPEVTLDDPVAEIMPIDSRNVAEVLWEQRDNFTGLTMPRIAGGEYNKVSREGTTVYKVTPAYFGDFKDMEEEFLTGARQPGMIGPAIDVREAQGSDQLHLLQRFFWRWKKICWDFLTLGKYSAVDRAGNVVAADKTSLTPFTVATAWSDLLNSTPLKDLRNLRKRHRGHSVSFDKNAKLYLVSDDVNNLLANINANDLGAQKFINIGQGSSVGRALGLADLNSYLFSQNLPQIVEWDDFWVDEDGTVNQFIAPGFGAVVGARKMGDAVSKYLMTRNPKLIYGTGQGTGISGNQNGRFDNLYYNFCWKGQEGPEAIRAISTLGFNGAPAVYFPSAIVPFRT